jgi:RNA polymerase sigma-70 factor (ECF subfamily)
VDTHHDALWRFVRRMGVAEAQVEDAVQQVLWVFARRLSVVERGAERSFLFGTALRVASEHRRKAQREPALADPGLLRDQPDPAPDAEARLGDKQLRRLLDELLDGLPPEQRAVFVLAELEELTMVEIGRVLSVPQGTVASRLRRARESIEARGRELRSRMEGAPSR